MESPVITDPDSVAAILQRLQLELEMLNNKRQELISSLRY